MRHWSEEVARDYLQGLGYTLLEENYAVRGGEIDLIMRDGEEIVFVEVRQRQRDDFGSAGESLDRRKLQRLRRATALYLARANDRRDSPVRMDAILLHGTRTRHTLEHLRNIG